MKMKRWKESFLSLREAEATAAVIDRFTPTHAIEGFEGGEESDCTHHHRVTASWEECFFNFASFLPFCLRLKDPPALIPSFQISALFIPSALFLLTSTRLPLLSSRRLVQLGLDFSPSQLPSPRSSNPRSPSTCSLISVLSSFLPNLPLHSFSLLTFLQFSTSVSFKPFPCLNYKTLLVFSIYWSSSYVSNYLYPLSLNTFGPFSVFSVCLPPIALSYLASILKHHASTLVWFFL